MSRGTGTQVKKHKPLYRRWWFILIFGCVAIAALANANGKNNEAELVSANDGVSVPIATDGISEPQVPESVYEYDTLQELFMRISLDTTEDDIIREYEQNKLQHDKRTYSGSKSIEYTIGYEYVSGRNPIKGDTVEVTFDTANGKLKYAVYTKSFVSAVLYNYGIYWDLRDGDPESNTVEYYGDIVGKHAYERVNSAEEAIQYVLDNQRKQ